jgi:NAD-dependent dihydropyrimidine dehydrogenase PreA subunit
MNGYEPKYCEHELVWETRDYSYGSSSGIDNTAIVYRTISCVLFFCKYPEKTCRVKAEKYRLIELLQK